jgi:hypothetical protein
MLPDGEVLVDRSFGRVKNNRGPDTGNLSIRCVEPGRRWTLEFDGAGEKTTTQELGRAPAGAGVAVPFRFSVELEAVVPAYDMQRAMGQNIDWDMAHLHQQQGFRATGAVTVPGRSWDIDGAGIRDHSRGERDFTRFGGHVWNYTVWPQSHRALSAFVMWRPGDPPRVNTSVMMIIEKGQAEVLSDFTITGTTSRGGEPHDLELRAIRADGSSLELRGVVEHNVTMTYAIPNHNLNGNWSAAEHGLNVPMVADESVVRWTWPDGDVGYSCTERAFQQSIMPSPVAPLPPGSVFNQRNS